MYSASVRVAGFTLAELLVTIALVAILAAVALPSFRQVSSSNANLTLNNQLIADLNLARSAAAQRGTTVGLIANSGGWANGWSVATGSFSGTTFTASTAVLAIHPSLDANALMSAASGNGDSVSQIVFNGSGNSVVSIVASAPSIMFSVCRKSETSSPTQQATVFPSGMVSSKKTTTNSTATACS